MEKTIKQQLLELGMKEEELGNWCSDLHVLKNEISTAFVKGGYQFPKNVTTFRSQIDGKLWYDIPFAYSEYYANRTLVVKLPKDNNEGGAEHGHQDHGPASEV